MHSNSSRTYTFVRSLALSFMLALACRAGYAQQVTSDVANFYPLLDAYAGKRSPSLSYLAKDWKHTEKWRKVGRAKLQELLAFEPEKAPLNTEILSTTKRDGYTQYLVRYNLNALQKTEAFLLVPDNLTKPTPAVIALHDHGGFYYFGKEKHTYTDNQPDILKAYVQDLYEGRYYADELAKRGFVVLCPDAIYFGSQKINPAQLVNSKGYFEKVEGVEESERIRTFNKQVAGLNEVAMNKTILASGTTWLGIIAQNDRVAVDFLLSRPEVDPERIGCVGLSLGGLRSTYLFGLDPRIKTGVVAAFSTTYEEMLQQHAHHTWMMYVPRQNEFLDLPDVASLNAPRPLMVMNCRQDKLFSIAGMQAAEQKLAGVYSRMKAPDKFTARYYDEPHSMTIEMQEDAMAWLEKWLK
ncbi:alpha/beta hydrolase family protein [Pontibacter ummariensis]|uniref:Abhydrolase family protein n=1 Tax=Pontibacter ummariensis TaxID=1610492 RepID=A0A239H668_9BACT|nr:alpha/beta hydrolase family protein [Pontibacter ummariensis]PRY10905.1 alpha/beta hydrolase family protein [Pontibacter ummariensis]SNS75774.1 Abhydrolase family protein [Pontibacter ummariensis]